MVIAAGNAALASAETTCESVEPARTSVICRTSSEQGKEMTLSIDGDRVTRQTVAARFCSVPNASIDEARLWMPEHEHDSGVTRLTRTADGCTEIADVEFLMLGLWEVQIHFPDDGDRGVFEVQVVR